MLEDLFERTEHLVQQSVESMLKQMLKPFNGPLFIVLLLILLDFGLAGINRVYMVNHSKV